MLEWDGELSDMPIAICDRCGEMLQSDDTLVIHGLAGHPITPFEEHMRAPFPWFGGKRRVASEVWPAFGNVVNYVEPFFGSGAVLLNRPAPFSGQETVNDKDGYVANFWRAVSQAPDEVAHYADNPVNENDLHARHVWLLGQRELVATLEGDPDFYDAKIAGWWAWGISCWTVAQPDLFQQANA